MDAKPEEQKIYPPKKIDLEDLPRGDKNLKKAAIRSKSRAFNEPFKKMTSLTSVFSSGGGGGGNWIRKLLGLTRRWLPSKMDCGQF